MKKRLYKRQKRYLKKYIPRERITVPSSAVEILPSLSLSKSWNPSLQSAICCSVSAAYSFVKLYLLHPSLLPFSFTLFCPLFSHSKRSTHRHITPTDHPPTVTHLTHNGNHSLPHSLSLPVTLTLACTRGRK
jgi:hypothetical protein